VGTPVSRVGGRGYVVDDPTIKYLLAEVPGIPLTAGGVTPLFSPVAGKSAICTDLFLRVTAAAGASAPTVGAGANGTQDDVFPSVALTGLTVVGLTWNFVSANVLNRVLVGGADTISLGVDVTSAGVLTVTAYLYGFQY
jgi:hypothetical protein